MKMSMIELPPRAEALKIDARTTTWLLERPRLAQDFFFRGVIALRPRRDQTVLGKVIAEAEFVSGNDLYCAIAILSQPSEGVHRLLDVAIRRQRDDGGWPTLCSEFDEGFPLDASSPADRCPAATIRR